MFKDIWEPFIGCQAKSEACQNCPFLSRVSFRGNIVQINKDELYYPLQKDSTNHYIVPSGAVLRVCVATSDLFYEGVDIYRDQIWNIMRQRPDITFYLLTKRPERVYQCLPKWWKEKPLENILFNVTCENQKRVNERLPILRELPFKRKGVCATPLLEKIDIKQYLQEGWIEQVKCSGERRRKQSH